MNRAVGAVRGENLAGALQLRIGASAGRQPGHDAPQATVEQQHRKTVHQGPHAGDVGSLRQRHRARTVKRATLLLAEPEPSTGVCLRPKGGGKRDTLKESGIDILLGGRVNAVSERVDRVGSLDR